MVRLRCFSGGWATFPPYYTYQRSGSVHVAVLQLINAQRRDKGPARVEVEVAVFGRDVTDRLVDVLGHRVGRAADVQLSPVLQPSPQLRASPAHQVLHIDLLLLVPGECQVKLGEQPVGVHRLDLVAVVEVSGGVLLAEEQPVGSGGAEGGSFLQGTAERGDPG